MPPGNTPAEAAAADGPAQNAERLNTRAAGVVGLAVLCSRVLGLAREQIFAALFGGGRIMDAFTIAFRIPNLLRDLFAEGALSTAFVTIFSKTVATDGEAAAWRLANKVATLTAVSLSAITVLGIVFAPWLVAVLAPGFEGEKAALTVTLTRVMYPFILLVSLAALWAFAGYVTFREGLNMLWVTVKANEVGIPLSVLTDALEDERQLSVADVDARHRDG